MAPRRGVEEVVAHFDSRDRRIELPLALAADRDEDARIIEVRVYSSTWPLTGGHPIRALLQPDPELHEAVIVGDVAVSGSRAATTRSTPGVAAIAQSSSDLIMEIPHPGEHPTRSRHRRSETAHRAPTRPHPKYHTSAPLRWGRFLPSSKTALAV